MARTTGIFFKIRHFVTLDTLKLLYYSLFCSFTSYGIFVWGLTHPCKNSYATFQDSGKKSSELSHSVTNMLAHHLFNLLCFVFQCNQVTSIGPFQNYFVPLTSVYNYNTRKASKGDMYISGINTTLYGKRIYRYNTMEQLEYQYKAQSLFKYF